MRELLRRLFLVDLLKGMWLTFSYQAPKNIYTEQYPLERPMVAERYRGAPRLNMNPETGEIALHRLQSVRAGVPGKSDRGGLAARRCDAPQSSHELHLRHFALHVLRPVRRCLPHRLPGTDAGFRDGKLQSRRRHLGPAPPGSRPDADALHSLIVRFPSSFPPQLFFECFGLPLPSRLGAL